MAGSYAGNRNPEQIHNKTIQLGSVSLFKDDLSQLIAFIKKDFSKGRVVTYCEAANLPNRLMISSNS